MITKEKLETLGRIHLERSDCSQLKRTLEPAEWSKMSTNYFHLQFLHIICVFLLTLKTKRCSAREANRYTTRAAQVLCCSVQSHVLVYRLRSSISYSLPLFCPFICAAAAEALGSATGGVLLNWLIAGRNLDFKLQHELSCDPRWYVCLFCCL